MKKTMLIGIMAFLCWAWIGKRMGINYTESLVFFTLCLIAIFFFFVLRFVATTKNKKARWEVLSWTFVLVSVVVGWRDISPHVLKSIVVLNVGLFRIFIAGGCMFLALCIKVGTEVFILRE